MVSGKGQFTIQLDVIGQNLKELLETQRGMAGVRKEATELQHMFKVGLGIDIAGRFNQAIASLPGAFKSAIDRGIQFNATLEQAQLGIAAVLKQFDRTGSIKNFDEAMRRSGAAIDILKQKAKESPATFEQLVQTFQAISGPALSAGISVERTVDLIVNMSQALSGLGIQSGQILQETRALLTGNINADAAAAKILSITSADIARAKEQGQLYEFLTGKIAAFAEAGQRGAGTLTTAMSNLDDAITDLLAKATKPIFDELTKGVLSVNEALDNPETVEALKAIGMQIADLVAAGANLTEFAVRNADALLFVAHAAAAVGLAFTALKIRDLIVLLGNKAKAWIAAALPVEAETVALQRNTAALLANNAARRGSAAAEIARNATAQLGTGSAARSGLGVAGTLGLGLGVLAVGAQLIQTLEKAALVRLEREDAVAAALAKQERSLVQQIAQVKDLNALTNQRADLAAELADIPLQQAAVAQAMANDSTAGSAKGYLDELAGLERRKRQLESAIRIIDARGPQIVDANVAAAASAEAVAKQEDAFAKAQQTITKLEEKVKALRFEYSLLNKDAVGQLAQLQDALWKIDETLAAQVSAAQAGPDAEKAKVVVEALKLQADEKRLPLLTSIAAVEQQISEESEKEAEAKKKAAEETKKAAEEAAKAAKEERERARAIEDGLAALRLAQIQADRGRIEANPFATTEQKRQDIQPILQRQAAALRENIALQSARMSDSTLELRDRIAAEERLTQLLGEQNSVQRELALGTFGGEFRAELTAWMDSFGTNAQQVAGILTGTVGSAIDSISGNLASAILRTQDWGDAWDNIKLAVAQTFLQMVIRYAAARAAMFALSRMFGLSEVAAGFLQAQATAAAWAPAAVAVNTATFGAAAAIGTGSYLSALATGTTATLLMGAPGFRDGGLFRGEGTGTSDSNLIRISDKEYIIRNAAVQRYGADVFDAFNNLQVGTAPIAAGAGVSGPAVSSSQATGNDGGRTPNVTVLVIPDEREATRIARHSAARGDIVRIVREERSTIFGN